KQMCGAWQLPKYPMTKHPKNAQRNRNTSGHKWHRFHRWCGERLSHLWNLCHPWLKSIINSSSPDRFCSNYWKLTQIHLLMKKIFGNLFWLVLAVAGGWAYATLATHRGESINSSYILIAALCTYAIGYRFYSKWIAAGVLALDDRRATPCEVRDDGRD